jgi:hypothetical protein
MQACKRNIPVLDSGENWLIQRLSPFLCALDLRKPLTRMALT